MASSVTETTGTKYITALIVIPMAVKAVIELGIPDILAKAEGGKALSAREILAKLPTKTTPGPNSFSNLGRLMKPLVQEGFFSQTLNEKEQPVYGLTEISKLCVVDNEWSLVPCSELVFNRQMVGAFSWLREVILDEENTPFAAECGMTLYEYIEKHPQFAVLFDKAMTAMTGPELKGMVNTLQQSGWLEGVKTFVDMGGGGQGTLVGQVVARNPHIQGINFDRPGVLEGAPEIKGVQHVGGDFFKAVLSGDALFMKHIMHNYDDKTCIKILTKCFEALSKGGKVIIVESMVPDSNISPTAAYVAIMDLCMLGMLKGGKERTGAEYQRIMSAAGFSNISIIPRLTGKAQYQRIMSAAGFSNISSIPRLTGKDLIQGIKE